MKKGKKRFKGPNPKNTSDYITIQHLRSSFGQQAVEQYYRRGVARFTREQQGLCL